MIRDKICDLNIVLLDIFFRHFNSEINFIRNSSFDDISLLTSSFCPRYPLREGLYPLIYRDPLVGDRLRRDIRHRRRPAPPEVAAAVVVAAVEAAAEAAAGSASSPAPVPGCRHRVLYQRPRCSPEAATSLEHLSTPATRRSRGDNPAGTHPPRLPGEYPRVISFSFSCNEREK